MKDHKTRSIFWYENLLTSSAGIVNTNFTPPLLFGQSDYPRMHSVLSISFFTDSTELLRPCPELQKYEKYFTQDMQWKDKTLCSKDNSVKIFVDSKSLNVITPDCQIVKCLPDTLFEVWSRDYADTDLKKVEIYGLQSIDQLEKFSDIPCLFQKGTRRKVNLYVYETITAECSLELDNALLPVVVKYIRLDNV